MPKPFEDLCIELVYNVSIFLTFSGQMHCMGEFQTELIQSVLNQFTHIDYCLPHCQMVSHNIFEFN